MVTCTCYDYQHGHLCKHSHRIYSLQHQQSPVDPTILDKDLPFSNSKDEEPSDTQEVELTMCSDDSISVHNNDTTQNIGIIPSKSARDEAGMHSAI